MSCVVCPNAKNKITGALNPSKFFKGLLGYHQGDRKKTKEDYVTGTHPKFKEKFGNKVKFDENDEPTLDSYIEFSEGEVDVNRRITTLNKQLKSGEYNLETALSMKKAFEDTNDEDVNSRYEVLLTPVENHNFKIEVVKKSDLVPEANKKAIYNKTLFERIRNSVRALGADFTYTAERYSSYSTENIEKLTNGLLGLIKLSHGNTDDITKEAAHEAGHLAIGALGLDNPLIHRLDNALTDEVIDELMPEEKDAIRAAKKPNREAMGTLVGKYINQEVDKKSKLNRLLERIVNNAKKIFYTLTKQKIEKYKVEANMVAENIAYNFMTQKEAGNIENAKSFKETLYSRVEKDTNDIMKDMFTQMSALAKRMGSFNTRHEKNLKKVLASITKEVFTSTGIDKEELNILSEDPIRQMLIALQGYLDPEKFEADMETAKMYMDDMDNLTRSAVALEELSNKLDTCGVFLTMLDNIIKGANPSSTSTIKYNVSDEFVEQLNFFKSKFEQLYSGCKQVVASQRRTLFLSFLGEIYGDNYIERSDKLIFRNYKLISTKDLGISGRHSIEEYLDNLEQDNSWIRRFLPLGNSSDVISQICAMAIKRYKNKAYDTTREDIAEIWSLRKYQQDNDIDTIELFEKSWDEDLKKNVISGNYISEVNFGLWEKNKAKKEKEIKDNFEQYLLDNYGKKPSEIPYALRSSIYNEYHKEAIKEWHNENSVLTDDFVYIPTGSQIDEDTGEIITSEYTNYDYYEKFLGVSLRGVTITDKEKQKASKRKFLLDKLEEIKAMQDRKLYQFGDKGLEYPNQLLKIRMPQFRGRTTDEIINAVERADLGNKSLAASKALAHKISSVFLIHANDTDFGDRNPRNTDPEDKFDIDEDLRRETSNCKKVTTYGIRKLDNMEELTRDVFAGLIQYSNMANNYEALYSLSATLEIGKRELSARDQRPSSDGKRGRGSENKLNPASSVYNNYVDTMETQVYSYMQHFVLGNVDVTKLTGWFNGIMSKVLLAGNVFGAAVNTGSGQMELLKEAFVGTEFNLVDLAKAEFTYFWYLGRNLWHSGRQHKNDKLALFTKEFNIGGRGMESVHNYNSRLDNWYGNILNVLPMIGNGNSMWVYTAGDHFMQTIPYILAAQKARVKLKDGKYVSLWEALKPVSTDHKNVMHLELNERYNYELKGGNHQLIVSDRKEDGTLFEKTVNYEELGKFQIIEKTSECSNRMYGVYNTIDKTKWMLSMQGRFITNMKGYVIGRGIRDFTDAGFSVALKRDSEGTIDTGIKAAYMELGAPIKLCYYALHHNTEMVKTSLKELGLMSSLLVLSAVPVHPLAKKCYTKLGFDIDQYKNMVRMFATFYIQTILYQIFKWGKAWIFPPDEDDEELEELADEKGIKSKLVRKEFIKREKKSKKEAETAKQKKLEEKFDDMYRVVRAAGFTKIESLQFLAKKYPKYKDIANKRLEDYKDDKIFELKSKREGILQGLTGDALKEKIRKDKAKRAEENREAKKAETARKKEEEKERKKLTDLQKFLGVTLCYAPYRIYTEQAGYLPIFTPGESFKEWSQVLQVFPATVSAFMDFYKVVEEDEVAKEWKEVFNEDMPVIEDGPWAGYSRTEKEIYKRLPYIKNIGIWNDPIKAIDSYEFQRKQK